MVSNALVALSLLSLAAAFPAAEIRRESQYEYIVVGSMFTCWDQDDGSLTTLQVELVEGRLRLVLLARDTVPF